MFVELINTIQDFVDTAIVEIIFTAIMTYGGWLARWFFRTRESREALHSAIHTGVGMITNEIFDLARPEHADRSDGVLIDKVVAYARGSVPDSIKWLKADDVTMRNMAKAYINAKRFGD